MRSRFGKVLFGLAFVITLTVFVSAVTFLVVYKYFYDQAESKEVDIIEEIQQRKEETIVIEQEEVTLSTVETPVEPTETPEEQPEEEPYAKYYLNLKEENDDLFGWIKIDGTNIDYPVMFTPNDPNFYEHRNWNKEKCYSGGSSIWLDGQTQTDGINFFNNNVIIYGHNMNNGTMFADLKNFTDESFYKEHKYIQFDTLYEKQLYEIVCVAKSAVYYTNPPAGAYLYYEHQQLSTEEEFDAYFENVRQRECYSIETPVEFGDQLITLSTCNYWTKDGRLIVIAKRVETNEDGTP